MTYSYIIPIFLVVNLFKKGLIITNLGKKLLSEIHIEGYIITNLGLASYLSITKIGEKLMV
ncbi:hypothetical protein ABID42_004277 [Arcicella rosea]